MEQYQRVFWEIKADLLLTGTGTQFEDAFDDIMRARHGPDFQLVRAAGGDQKCDGRLMSKRQHFAVHAPGVVRISPMNKKIQEDFDGAVTHWGDSFDQWIYVHNREDGLPPEVVKQLGNLDGMHGKRVLEWGPREVKKQLFLLSPAQIRSILGPVPSRHETARPCREDVDAVLDHVEEAEPPDPEHIRPVRPDKASHNKLSGNVTAFLALGKPGSVHVARYLDTQPQVERAERICEAFRRAYEDLHSKGFDPDAIFTQMLRQVGGGVTESAPREGAKMALLAYLFDTCTIFEG